MQTVKQGRYFLDPAALPNSRDLAKLERALEQQEVNKQRQLEATQRSLEALRLKYLTSRIEILGEGGNRQLSEFMQQHRQSAPALAQPLSEQDAHKTQVAEPIQSRLVYPEPPVSAKSLEALNALNIETRKQFNSIVAASLALEENSQLDEKSSDKFSVLGSAYFPPYWWWERNIFDNYDFATGSGQIKQHQSFLWPEAGRTGSCIWGQNMSADDTDLIQMTRGNGFFVGYTTPTAGKLRVGIELECGWCEHCIQTWNEFGWSDVDAVTREILSVGLLYNWTDPDLAVDIRDNSFVSGLRASGNGDRSPGIVYPFSTGQKRYFSKDININLAAGTYVYVYVGTEQQAWSWLNDVSCNIFNNSAWYVKRISVQTI